MKRYMMICVEDIIESEDGHWVEAEVAQALYDALNQITESFQGQQHLRGDHYSMAIEALSLADGEER